MWCYDNGMSFKTCDKARQFMIGAGIGAAPFVIAWHECPKSEENPLAPPPDHVEQYSYHPIQPNRIEVLTSASSSTANLDVRVDAEHMRVGDQLFKVFRVD